MSIKINKNGKEYPLGFMPKHYPADRVYLDGDTTKTVQDECVRKTGDTMTGDLTLEKQGTVLTIRAGGSKSTRITSSASGSDRDIVLPNQSGTLALTSDLSSVVYSENITALNGSKTISNIPFKSIRALYLACWASDYPANDSGAWLVFISPIPGQTMLTPLYEKNITMSVSGTTITLNQTSGNADNGTFYVMELSR